MGAVKAVEADEGAIDIEDADDALPETCVDSGMAVFHRLYAEFDPEARTVTFGDDHPSVNGVPFKVWHNRAIRFYAPRGADAEQVGDVLRDPAMYEKLRAIADSYECTWDGHNHVGKYGEAWGLVQEVQDAVTQIEPRWSACRFDEWVEPAKANIVAELRAPGAPDPATLASRITAEAQEDKLILVGDGGEVLSRWLNESEDD